jgi:hypothetical protein
MNKSIFTLAIITIMFFLSSCGPSYGIRIRSTKQLPSQEKLINLSVREVSLIDGSPGQFKCDENLSRGALFFEFKYMINEELSWPVIRSKSEARNKKWKNVFRSKNGRGRFKVKKEDIYLIHDGSKVVPRIYWGDEDLEAIESNEISYPDDWNRYASNFVTFPITCIDAISKPTKLVIKKIFKDDKIILKDIEFDLILIDDNWNNKPQKIWLE